MKNVWIIRDFTREREERIPPTFPLPSPSSSLLHLTPASLLRILILSSLSPPFLLLLLLSLFIAMLIVKCGKLVLSKESREGVALVVEEGKVKEILPLGDLKEGEGGRKRLEGKGVWGGGGGGEGGGG